MGIFEKNEPKIQVFIFYTLKHGFSLSQKTLDSFRLNCFVF